MVGSCSSGERNSLVRQKRIQNITFLRHLNKQESQGRGPRYPTLVRLTRLGMASTTKILRLSSLLTSTAASLAAESLASGSVIAVPTDTIYGLACLVQVTLIVINIIIVNVIVIQHSAAVERLYTIKVSVTVFPCEYQDQTLSGKKCQEAHRDLCCGD